MIDAAIIGLGWWGRRHVTSVQGKSPGLRYVLGVTQEPDEIEAFAAEHGLPIATDYEAALTDPAVRAVILATPHSLHPAQIEAAAAAGKHVFCEKPLALDAGDAARAAASCRDAGVVLGVGHDWRYRPAMVEIKRMIVTGELGTVMQVEANYSHDVLADVPPDAWRADAAEAPVGGMTGMGVHMTDAYIGLLGKVREVHARLSDRVLGRPSGDTVAVSLEFANGALGYFGTTMVTAYLWHIRVLGSNGYVEARSENELTIHWRGREPETRVLDTVDAVRAGIEAFARSVETGEAYPIPEDQIVHNVAVLQAIFASATTGQPEQVR
jgi:predicted dehydrogenase